jgi:8-oxo-dGTP diphosphatase
MSALPRLHVVGAAILREGRCLAAQRGAAMPLAGQWEFPGGKVEPGEDPRAALRREIREELGLDVEVGDLLARGEALERTRRIVLDVYLADVTGGELALSEHAAATWVGADELYALDWAAADVPVLGALEARLRLPHLA